MQSLGKELPLIGMESVSIACLLQNPLYYLLFIYCGKQSPCSLLSCFINPPPPYSPEMNHLCFLTDLNSCQQKCDYLLLPFIRDSSPIAHYRVCSYHLSHLGLLEERFLVSLCQHNLGELVNSISSIRSEGSVFQRSYYQRFCPDHLNPPFHLESWIQLSKSEAVPSTTVCSLFLLFLAINSHSTSLPLIKRNRSQITFCDPLLQSFLSSLAPPTPPDFDNQDTSLQRVLQLEDSLPHAAKSSLQLAAEFMSLGEIDKYISSSSPMQGAFSLSHFPIISTRRGRNNRTGFTGGTAIEGIAAIR